MITMITMGTLPDILIFRRTFHVQWKTLLDKMSTKMSGTDISCPMKNPTGQNVHQNVRNYPTYFTTTLEGAITTMFCPKEFYFQTHFVKIKKTSLIS